jgi:hypothetical protein
MTVDSSTRNTNWWGLASLLGLFVLFLFYFKNEPQTHADQVFFLGVVAVIHFLAIKAARRRHGWIYFVPLALLWLILLVGLSGGIPWS